MDTTLVPEGYTLHDYTETAHIYHKGDLTLLVWPATGNAELSVILRHIHISVGRFALPCADLARYEGELLTVLTAGRLMLGVGGASPTGGAT